MKKIATLLTLLVLSAFAQDEAAVQTGTPARLEAINGKQIKVFLQSLEDGKVTFQPFKSDKSMTVGIDKIRRFEFYPKYDAEACEAAFNEGDYATVLSVLDPVLESFAQYMPVENNLQPAFVMQMKSRFSQGEFSKVRKSADLLLATRLDPGLALQGQVCKALAALAEGDFSTAGKLHGEIESEAAKRYLQACIQRAQGQAREAMQTVVGIIAEHGNEVEWLGPGELLSAHLYLDLAMTNSALNTARQVKSIYAGTHIAADAGKLYTELVSENEPTQ